MVATRRCLAALLVIAASCAHPSSNGSTESDVAETRPRVTKNPLVISKEELRDPVIISMDAMAAIRYLRPSFFRTTGPQSVANESAGSTHISADYGPLQSLSQLRSFTPITLVEVRYLDANEAQVRFGLNAAGGPVIVLLSSKQ